MLSLRLFFTSISLFSFHIFSLAQNSLTVEIKNIRNASGCILISLYSAEDGFPNNADKALKKGKLSSVSKESVLFTFKDVVPGTYAVSVFHDEDCNGQMKTNVLGIPLEGTAASNDARGRFGPPKFADAKFSLSGDKRISLSLYYY
jgi:uncharacterized protein (DUF2141 family)